LTDYDAARCRRRRNLAGMLLIIIIIIPAIYAAMGDTHGDELFGVIPQTAITFFIMLNQEVYNYQPALLILIYVFAVGIIILNQFVYKPLVLEVKTEETHGYGDSTWVRNNSSLFSGNKFSLKYCKEWIKDKIRDYLDWKHKTQDIKNNSTWVNMNLPYHAQGFVLSELEIDKFDLFENETKKYLQNQQSAQSETVVPQYIKKIAARKRKWKIFTLLSVLTDFVSYFRRTDKAPPDVGHTASAAATVDSDDDDSTTGDTSAHATNNGPASRRDSNSSASSGENSNVSNVDDDDDEEDNEEWSEDEFDDLFVEDDLVALQAHSSHSVEAISNSLVPEGEALLGTDIWNTLTPKNATISAESALENGFDTVFDSGVPFTFKVDAPSDDLDALADFGDANNKVADPQAQASPRRSITKRPSASIQLVNRINKEEIAAFASGDVYYPERKAPAFQGNRRVNVPVADTSFAVDGAPPAIPRLRRLTLNQPVLSMDATPPVQSPPQAPATNSSDIGSALSSPKLRRLTLSPGSGGLLTPPPIPAVRRLTISPAAGNSDRLQMLNANREEAKANSAESLPSAVTSPVISPSVRRASLVPRNVIIDSAENESTPPSSEQLSPSAPEQSSSTGSSLRKVQSIRRVVERKE